MSDQEDLYPEVQKDAKGIAHIKGCYIWCIARITRDVGVRADWYEAIHKVYPHLTRDDITTAFAYDGEFRDEIEPFIQQSYEEDGTAQKRRDRKKALRECTWDALMRVREAVLALERADIPPGTIYLGGKFSWHLMRHKVQEALGHEYDPDGQPDTLFGIPVIRTGKQTFVISEAAYGRCEFVKDDLPEPREAMGMGK